MLMVEYVLIHTVSLSYGKLSEEFNFLKVSFKSNDYSLHISYRQMSSILNHVFSNKKSVLTVRK